MREIVQNIFSDSPKDQTKQVLVSRWIQWMALVIEQKTKISL